MTCYKVILVGHPLQKHVLAYHTDILQVKQPEKLVSKGALHLLCMSFVYIFLPWCVMFILLNWKTKWHVQGHDTGVRSCILLDAVSVRFIFCLKYFIKQRRKDKFYLAMTCNELLQLEYTFTRYIQIKQIPIAWISSMLNVTLLGKFVMFMNHSNLTLNMRTSLNVILYFTCVFISVFQNASSCC